MAPHYGLLRLSPGLLSVGIKQELHFESRRPGRFEYQVAYFVFLVRA